MGKKVVGVKLKLEDVVYERVVDSLDDVYDVPKMIDKDFVYDAIILPKFLDSKKIDSDGILTLPLIAFVLLEDDFPIMFPCVVGAMVVIEEDVYSKQFNNQHGAELIKDLLNDTCMQYTNILYNDTMQDIQSSLIYPLSLSEDTILYN